MLGLLPLLSLIVLSISVHSLVSKDRPLRESILIGFLLWGGIITGMMEIFSISHCLTFQWVLLVWSIVLAASIFVIGVRWKYLNIPWQMAYDLSLIEKVFLFVIFFIVAYLAGLAFFTPPNTIDAMTYHMSRVVHWIQNHTVAYYPTHILRQLIFPPGVEYAIFQFQILSKGDQWANCVQWLSMTGSLLGVSLVAKELGAGRWGQILSVIIAATIPMGILQSTSTQTDYGVTLWLCEFIYFFSRWRKCLTWEYTSWMAMALGLAFLAKGTGIVYSIPFLFWILVIVVRRFGFKILVKLFVVLIVVSILNSGMLYRNAQLFHGHVLVPVRGTEGTGMDSIINDHFGWQELGANTLRNAGLELRSPWVEINRITERFLYKTSDVLHVDMNDLSSSFQRTPFVFGNLVIFEDLSGCPLDALLVLVAIILIAVFPSLRNKEMVFYLLALIGMMISFNLILKWQCWGSRYHLAFFVMAAPLIGAVFEKIRFRAMVVLVMAGVIACALPYVLHNSMKSFATLKNVMHQKDRNEEYYDLLTLTQFKVVRNQLKNIQCHEVGLLLNEFVKEYPLWAVLDPSNDGSMRFEHIEVRNISSSLDYPLGKFDPCAIISVSYNFPYQGARLEQNMYLKVFSQGKDDRETDVFVRVN